MINETMCKDCKCYNEMFDSAGECEKRSGNGVWTVVNATDTPTICFESNDNNDVD